MRQVARQPSQLEPPAPADAVVFTVAIEAVTPIFRGGTRPDAIDAERPFRGASVRGLLRHWWRATREETDPRALWEAEASLFGAIRRDERAQASRVRVGIVGPPSREATKPAGLDYALWVHRPRDAGRLYHEGATATLTVEAPRDRAPEVRAALSVWLLVGGIGSRSRRGLGAVHASHPDVRPPLADANALVAHLSRFTPAAVRRDWPTLGGGAVLVGPPARGPVEAWRAAVQQMQAVRQYPAVRRWHDDDYVVFAAGRRFESRRAALGLPLQFQRRAGPEKWRMVPVVPGARTADRVPSPVHLRPVLLGDAWHPVMTVLRVPYPAELRVSGSSSASGQVDPAGVDWFVDGVLAGDGWSHHPLRSAP